MKLEGTPIDPLLKDAFPDIKVKQCYDRIAAQEVPSWRGEPSGASEPLLDVTELAIASDSKAVFGRSKIKITLLDLEALITCGHWPNLKKITLMDTSMDCAPDLDRSNQQPLSNIEEIDLIKSELNPTLLNKLIDCMPNLKKINLPRPINLRDQQIEWSKLPNLEEVNLESSLVNAISLKALINNTPKLKTINLASCIIDGEALSWSKPSQLEEIDLSGSNIKAMSLETLMGNAPLLKKINLCDCEQLDCNTTNWAGLSQLEAISLYHTNINTGSLNSLIEQAPLLKKINLTLCKNLGYDDINWGKPSQLEEIDLSGSNINAMSLKALIENSPHLKKINLILCKNLNDPTVDWSKLSQLEEIVLDNSNIDAISLKNLIGNAPLLKKINLIRCKNLDDPTIDWIKLPQLEEIDLALSDINAISLTRLIDNAPNLKKIDLSGCGNLSNADIDWSKLSQLEEIDLSESNINAISLKALIENSPHLKKINLSACINLSASDIDWSKLSQLEAIDLNASNIDAKSLKALIDNAPLLKKINLLNCKNLSGLNIDWSKLSQLEEISLEDWHSFLKAALKAPNLLTKCRDRLQRQLLKPQRTATPILEQSQAPLLPRHDPQAMKDFKPTSKDKPFEFTGKHAAPNQLMVIEKLSQYLTLKNRNTHIISKIQDGICNALTKFFIDKGTATWNNAIRAITEWNGKTEISRELEHLFEELTHYVQERQLTPTTTKKQFLGEALAPFLATLSNDAAVVLNNPWHAIAIRRLDALAYEIYDPNLTTIMRVSSIELKPTIAHILGALGGVESNDSTLQPAITSAGEFIRDGGLLSLCDSGNRGSLLDLIEVNSNIKAGELQGLLLRNIKGDPAWMIGMNHTDERIKRLTTKWLTQFRSNNPDADKQLEQSMAGVPPMQRHALAEDVIDLIPAPVVEPVKSPETPSPVVASQKAAAADNLSTPLAHLDPMSLIELTAHEIPEESTFARESAALRETLLALSRTPHTELSKQRLTTWQTTTTRIKTLNEYFQQTLGDSHEFPTRLIECTSSEDIDGLGHKLQQYCKHTSRPVFYIDKPDDLICSAPFLFENEMTHTAALHKGPGGPLYDFLIAHQGHKPPPVLLVNYATFHADDIVRFNGLLDTIPQADGTKLPAKTTVIGLINTSDPDCYQGADFYSRFKVKDRQPFPSESLKTSLPPVIPAPEGAEKTVINLYRAPDWEARLLGAWVMEGGTFSFQEGELQKAIQKGGPIEIQNGFFGEAAFDRFWQQLRQEGVHHAGRRISIPEGTVIYQHQGYDWPALQKSMKVEQSEKLSPENPTLNMGSLPQFLGIYKLQKETKTLTKRPGLIAGASKGAVLQVNVTAPLTDDAWAMLLNECQQHGVTLQAHSAPGVTLPKAMGYEPHEAPKPKTWATGARAPFEVIVSNDIDTTVYLLTKGEQDWKVIDISEVQAHDLLMRLDGALNADAMQLEFTEKEGALLSALKKGEKVLLKGDFSQALIDALAPLLIEQEYTPSGQLKLVTTQASPFAFLNTTVMHKVVPKDKSDALSSLAKKRLKLYSAEPLSQLKAREAYLMLHPDGNSDDAWKGMMHLPSGVDVPDVPIDVTTTLSMAEAFTTGRKDAVTAVLKDGPYVFLTGLSGVGKTTFIHNELCPEASPYQLFNDEHQMAAWAQAPANPNKAPLLFLDEANLSHRNWSEFEGLFQSPPGMLIDGTFYPLSPHHKVVFAGNPASYGDERKLAPFFKRHGAAVLFEPISNAVIYEKIIKPVFLGANVDPAEMQRLSQPILDAYALICKSTPTEMLISPRELQMMALLACSNYRKNKDVSLENHLKQSVYELGISLLPATDKAAKAQFEEQFKPAPTPAAAIMTIGENFLITASRQPIVQQLQERLQLREWRQEDTSLNDELKYGGLGGIILEGEPGIGKSELVIQALIDAGYEEAHQLTEPTQREKPFFRLPVSMGFADKKALLGKIFDEGGVVLIDEINSSPMMEQFLNALLMGRNPDNNNQRPTKPGFMVIGTQNPISMAGRRAASTALSRRMTTVELPDYTPEEMQAILVQKSTDPLDAKEVVESYVERQGYAKIHHLTPAPCFRDLLKAAEQVRLASKAATDTAMKEACRTLITEINEITPNTLKQKRGNEHLQKIFNNAPWEEKRKHFVEAIEASSGDRLIALHTEIFAKKMQVSHLLTAQEDAIAHVRAAATENKKLMDLLITLADKIKTIPDDKTSIKETAQTLLNNLKAAIRNYTNINSRERHNEGAFNTACETAINTATPILEKALSWGSFLMNLMKKLANGIAKAFTKETIFPMTTTEHTKIAKDTLKAIRSAAIKKEPPSPTGGHSNS